MIYDWLHFFFSKTPFFFHATNSFGLIQQNLKATFSTKIIFLFLNN